jgi:peptide/nickel transport system substrate-binding protein
LEGFVSVWNKRVLPSIPLVLLFALVVTACGGSSSQANANSLVIAVTPEPKSLNPDWQADPGSYWPSGNIYNHLVVSDWGAVAGTPNYADLAQTWDVSPDGTLYTFHLKQGVKWHDGQSFSSDDVLYTFQTIIDKKYPLAQYLAGATLSAPDPNTFVVKFAQPNVAFVPLLAQASNWYGAILPKHVYQGTDWSTNPANQKPVGTGPFKFVSWDRGTQVTLQSNPDYWRGVPRMSRVVLRFVSDGQVALSGFDAGQYPYLDSYYLDNFSMIKKKMEAGGSTVVVPTGSFYDLCLYLNLKDPILSNQKVREAISYAVDREALSQQAFFGLDGPNYYAGVPAIGSYLDKTVQFPHRDIAKAKQLLDEAGYPVKSDGTRFKLQITDYPEGDTDATSQVMVEQLKAVNIDATWQQNDAASWLSKARSGQFQMAVYFVRYGPDPAAYAEHFKTGSARDFTGYSNSDVDSWLAQAQTTSDQAKRAELYGKVQKQLTLDIPYISLATTSNYNFVRKGWHGFSAQPEAFNKSGGWFSLAGVYQAAS